MLVAGVPSVARFSASLWIPLLSLLLTPVDGERKLSNMQLKKKAIAKIVVALDRNVAAPLPPKTAPVIPEPPKAPANPSPLADCIRTTMIKAMQMITCSMVNKTINWTSYNRKSFFVLELLLTVFLNRLNIKWHFLQYFRRILHPNWLLPPMPRRYPTW